MADNWWDSAPVVDPATDPGFSGFIPGSPKPKEPKAPVFVPEKATRMYDPNTGSFLPVPQDPNADAEGKDALKEAIAGLGVDELLQSVSRARDNLKSGWATGAWGALAELKPGGGTPRDDFLGNLKAIQGGIILEKLQSLKEASKTGASGMGALSEKEGERLASSVSALTEDMSPQAYEQSLREIARHALTLQAVRDGKDPRQADVAKDIDRQATALSALNTDAPPPPPSDNNQPPPPGAAELNDEQKRAYAAFLKANPSPTGPQVETFLTGIGVPGVSNAAEIAKAIKAGQGVSTSIRRLDLEVEAKQKAEQMRRDSAKSMGGDQGAAAVGGFGTGALSGFLDEAGAGVSGLVESLQGKGSLADRYSVNLSANDQYLRGLRERNPWTYGISEVGGAVPALAMGASALRGTAIARAATDRLGRAGAAVAGNAGYGGAYGFGANNENRGAGALTGAVGGAAGGALGEYAIGPVAGRIADRVRGVGGRGLAPDVAEASQAEGVGLMRPMVDPKAIGQYGALESNVYSQPIIRGAAGRIRGQIEDRTIALGGEGTAQGTEAAGNIVQGAGRRFIQRSKGVADALYNRARNLGGDSRFVPEKAIAQVDDELAQLGSNPETNAGEIAFLNGLKRDLSAPGGKTIEELRQLRTSLRGRVNEQSLGATQAEARAMRAMDATQQDVAANVPAAASAFKRADTFYRERQTHIDDIIQRITGGKVGGGEFQVSGEQAFSRLKAMASPGGDGRRLAALMRDLEPNERQDIAATIAQGLGRRAPDEPFSTAQFLSQTNKLSPSARRTVFGPDGAQSIDNLRLLSRKLEEAEKDINRSRSATVLERQGWRNAARGVIGLVAGMGGAAATGGVSGGVAGVAVAGAAMGASATRRILSARALVNPRVSRWLAQTADVSSEAQAKEATRKLGVIIGREPAIAGELQPLYDFLQQRLTTPLAAQPQAEGGDNEQR